MVSHPELPQGSEPVAALRQFVTGHALPLWASAGWDASQGGFVERLHVDGSPDFDAPRRTFTQARQISSFAKAAQFGWHPGAKSLAVDGAKHLLTRIRAGSSDDGFSHLSDRACNVLDARRDTSDHAAILLALASVFDLTRDAQIRSEIDAVLLLIDRRLRSPDGGFLEGIPATLPRRLVTHTHLFEAMIALFDATGEPVFQQRAGEFFGLFMANLLDPASGTLGQYYENDWANITPVRIAPGQMAQWVWLLRGFERTTGCPTARHRTTLVQALARYRDPQTFLLVDESDRRATMTSPSFSLASQAALAKAFIAQAESGEVGAAHEARAAIRGLTSGYLSHPIDGGWRTVRGENSEQAIEAQDFYAIISLLSEAEQVLTQT